jgi:hypothetical protein
MEQSSSASIINLQDLKDQFKKYSDAELDLFSLILQSDEKILKEFDPWFQINSMKQNEIRKELSGLKNIDMKEFNGKN